MHAAAAVAAGEGDTLLRDRCEYVVTVLEACQEAAGDGYVSAFPQAEFAEVEDFRSRSPWVPYYVMHKLLAGEWRGVVAWRSDVGLQPAVACSLRISACGAPLRMHARRLVHACGA